MLMRRAATLFVALAALIQVTAVQTTSPSPYPLPEGLRVDEITEDTARGRTIVRGSIVQPDGAIVPGQMIVCERNNPELILRGQAQLIWQDHAAGTDDRIVVDAGVCDSLVSALRQLKDAQER